MRDDVSRWRARRHPERTTDERGALRASRVLVVIFGVLLGALAVGAEVVAREGMKDETEILIPVIDDVIREFDRAGGRLVIEAMPGLLESEAGRRAAAEFAECLAAAVVWGWSTRLLTG